MYPLPAAHHGQQRHDDPAPKTDGGGPQSCPNSPSMEPAWFVCRRLQVLFSSSLRFPANGIFRDINSRYSSTGSGACVNRCLDGIGSCHLSVSTGSRRLTSGSVAGNKSQPIGPPHFGTPQPKPSPFRLGGVCAHEPFQCPPDETTGGIPC